MSKAITAKVSEKSIVVTNNLTGSKLVIELGEKKKVLGNLTSEVPKEKQYGTYINKFVRELITTHFPKKMSMKDRFKKVGEAINKLENVNNFRTLSNNLRKTFDNGKLYPYGTYFYEGVMNTPPVEEAAQDNA